MRRGLGDSWVAAKWFGCAIVVLQVGGRVILSGCRWPLEESLRADGSLHHPAGAGLAGRARSGGAFGPGAAGDAALQGALLPAGLKDLGSECPDLPKVVRLL